MKSILDREEQYLELVDDILNHKEFLKTKDIVHHGMNRYDHSARVSYFSYKLAKLFCLDYEEVARAGLLHDFFLVDNAVINVKEKMNTLVNHPKYAVMYASKYFDLSEKEKDIITTHMFPVAMHTIPKYAESWIVNIVDNFVAICEALYTARFRCMKYANVMMIVVLNFLR